MTAISTKIHTACCALICAILTLGFMACHSIEEEDNTIMGNFDALWNILDRHYCFFDRKGVDWDEVYRRYRPQAKACRTAQQLFDVCARMLDELRDGHVNLSASFNTSYYRKWWSDYPQNYDERLVLEHYLNFDYRQAGALTYAMLPQRIGYVSYRSFSSTIGEGNLDAVLSYFEIAQGLIIDVRDNGGGNMTNVETLVRRFITGRTLAGYTVHKTGPRHGDFAEPYAYYYDAADAGRVRWLKPVVVLCNRSTFSAANNFVSVMRLLPTVTIVGATTGGGSGMPMSSELPCGWSIRFSACSFLDAQGNSTEAGVNPSQGCAVDLDPAQAAMGHDSMLDKAIAVIQSK